MVIVWPPPLYDDPNQIGHVSASYLVFTDSVCVCVGMLQWLIRHVVWLISFAEYDANIDGVKFMLNVPFVVRGPFFFFFLLSNLILFYLIIDEKLVKPMLSNPRFNG